ncbi:PAS domain-containing protein [Halorhodospira neutriphila]|uniref:histidine kinase n=1 Tax=Halorhodospira neutriphila TaxID=168379 RepID=A0ABS1E240_9GAMM|nr:PAS domain-containing protein [Halorhodospira neutriphila]MBK1725850.1 hypothetical protein [Halorhodospira neutriphila]
MGEEPLRTRFAYLKTGIYQAALEADAPFLDANPALAALCGLASVDELLAYAPRDFGLGHEEMAAAEPGAVQERTRWLDAADGHAQWVTQRVQRREIPGYGPFLEGAIEPMAAPTAPERGREQARLEEAQRLARVGHWVSYPPEGNRARGALWWSRVTYEIFGRDPKRFTPCIADFYEAIHPADRPYVERQRRHVEQAGTIELEHRIVRPDGEIRWVQQHKYAEYHDDGTLWCLFGTVQDITERRRAEEALRESEARFWLMAESLEEVFWLCDGEAQVFYVNGAYERLWGQSAKRLYADPFSFLEAVHPEDREPLRERITQYHQGSPELEETFRLLQPEGQVRWIRMRSRSVCDPQTQLVRRVGIAYDVTEYKELQHSLEAALNAKSKFLDSVSHDLRTPLNAVLGFTELLADSALDPQQRHYVGLCRTAGKRLLGLIDTLLDLSKLQAGRVSLQAETFELPAFLAEQLEILRHQAEQRSVELTGRIDEQTLPRWVHTDATRLAQVLFNLATNAIKFTEANPVRVEADADRAGRLRLRVHDHGPGIAAADQATIFEAFSRDAGHQDTDGSGLGLAIARELARLLGGELTVDSAPGQGATFTFMVALETAPGPPPSAAEEPPARAAEDPQKAPPRVLAVEDEPTNALMLRALLEQRGCTVLTAEDGAEALAAWRRERPGLVLLDLQLPGLSGEEVAEAIRREEAQHGEPRTPIAALTAHTTEEARARCYRAGCDTYLSKPVDREALERLLQQAPRGSESAHD